jgi:outer membrane protein TolC
MPAGGRPKASQPMLLAIVFVFGSLLAPGLRSTPSGGTPAEATHPQAVQADTLSLRAAFLEAESAFPLARRVSIEERISARGVLDIRSALRPDLTLSTQALWQSRVPSLPFALPGGSELSIPHDQYKAGLTISKLLWDGGRSRTGQAVVMAQPDRVRAEVEVAMVPIRDAILEAFFGTLEQEVRLRSLSLLRGDIEARLAQVEAGVDAGVRRETDSDVLRAEILKIQQQDVEIRAARRAFLQTLSTLIDRPLPENTELIAADFNPNSAVGKRPEQDLFDAQRTLTTLAAEVTASTQRPSVSVFGETAVGRPAGQDFFDDQFRPFASVGVRMAWPLLKWGRTRRARETASLRAEALDASQSAFEQALTAQLAAQRLVMEGLEESAEMDGQIVRLKRRVAERVGAEFERGTATASDYLVERNAAQQAELTGEIRRIRLSLARARYYNTSGGR